MGPTSQAFRAQYTLRSTPVTGCITNGMQTILLHYAEKTV